MSDYTPVFSDKAKQKMEAGNRMEYAVMQWVADVKKLIYRKINTPHPVYEFNDNPPSRPIMLATPDYISEAGPEIIEIKTTTEGKYWSDNKTPQRVYTQVQWQMHVWGIHKCIIGCLISGWDLQIRYQDYNAEYCKLLEDTARDFWFNNVKKLKEPI